MQQQTVKNDGALQTFETTPLYIQLAAYAEEVQRKKLVFEGRRVPAENG